MKEEITLMEAAGSAPVVHAALNTLRTAQQQLDAGANSSRSAKMMFSSSHLAARSSSRQPPTPPPPQPTDDTTGGSGQTS